MSEPPDFPLPQYRPTIIASCPTCCNDLIDEGFSYWCPACQEAVHPSKVAYFEDGHPDY